MRDRDAIRGSDSWRERASKPGRGDTRENLKIIRRTCRWEALACRQKHTYRFVPRGYL